MTQKKITRRRAVKLGAAAAVTIGGGYLLCSDEKKINEIDPDIFTDLKKEKIPAQDVIHPRPGFKGDLPNIIVILTDDLGYGDLGCYGGKAVKTPNIDRMAKEGMRFTDFYCSSPLCSPSRAGLLTGRYPLRSGITFPLQPGKDTLTRKLSRKAAYFLGSLGIYDLKNAENMVTGLPLSEITIAEALKVKGYNTCAVGKWHLGDFTVYPKYHPFNYGFDRFAGFNASNDDWPVSFWRGKKEIVKDIGLDQEKYTGLFTEEALDFIDESKDNPFFLYLAHKDPHQPCFPSEKFRDSTEGGRHGDTVREVDWSVGEILSFLEKKGLEKDTLVIFTSDNGPWYDGSPGGLRGRKGESYEGGYRVPMIARWPGKIPAGKTCRAPAMNFDFFPTFLSLAGLEAPADRTIDGKNIAGLLTGKKKKSPHDALYFFHYNKIEGVRRGKWKYFRSVNTRGWPIPLDSPDTFFGKAAAGHNYQPPGSDKSVPTMASWPVLYNMELDRGESYNVLKKYPAVGKELGGMIRDFEKRFFKNPRGWIGGGK